METEKIATAHVLAKLHQQGEHDTAKRLANAVGNTDPTLWQDEWIAVKKRDGWYTYTHQLKCNGQGVAVMGYRQGPAGLELVGRYENCPPHDDGITLCSLTGMVEGEDNVLQTAKRELWEEAGIDAPEGDFQYVGAARPSKASDTAIHLFLINVAGRDIGKATGDGTKGEEGAYCRWISFQDAVMSKDPILATLAARVQLGLGNGQEPPQAALPGAT